MRKSSETGTGGLEPNTDQMRATFVISRSLVDEFRLIAKRNQRTFSGELRKVIEDAVAQEREAA